MKIHFIFRTFKIIFPAKYRISTALIMENPVRSPMVPPMADNMSTNFAALSFLILSNVGVAKWILTYLRFASIGGSKKNNKRKISKTKNISE